AMRRIILPQALRRVLPPMTNEALTLLKNTALVSTIALADLLRSGLEVMTWQANTFSPFAGVALFYLALTLPLIWLNGRLEQRYRIHAPRAARIGPCRRRRSGAKPGLRGRGFGASGYPDQGWSHRPTGATGLGFASFRERADRGRRRAHHAGPRQCSHAFAGK